VDAKTSVMDLINNFRRSLEIEQEDIRYWGRQYAKPSEIHIKAGLEFTDALDKLLDNCIIISKDIERK
jgi:hypothetical protein